jgi:bacterioferritin-associated ferredoxin
MIVCICKRVSDRQIDAAIEAGAETVEEVGARCRAGTGCGMCRPFIEQRIERKDCDRLRLPVLSEAA